MRRRNSKARLEEFDWLEVMSLTGPNPTDRTYEGPIPNLAERWPAYGAEVVRATREAGGRWDPAARLPWVLDWGWPQGTSPDDPEPHREPNYGWGRVNGEWVPPGPKADIVDLDSRRRDG